MSPTIEDLRTTLDDVADSYTAPDPHTVLAGAHARSGQLGRRRRTTGRWAAAAAAVVVIGGAGLLLTDPAGNTQGEVAPAEPDESYTEGYGIVDGELQPHTADGLRLVDEVDLADEANAQLEVDSSSQLYAVAVCPSDVAGRSQPAVTILTRTWTVEVTCADESSDSPTLPVTSLPTEAPESDGVYGVQRTDDVGPVSVAFYAEEEWADYPFPATEPASFTFTMELDQPGQLLVAIDGVALTNDGETVGGSQQPAAEPWRIVNPALREGYLHSYGFPAQRSVNLNAQILAEEGIDVSDGEVTVSVHARGFVDDSAWRVVIGGTGGGEVGTPAPLEPGNRY